MSEDKLKVLEMIQEGKISAKEGMELLQALENVSQTGISSHSGGKRSLRIRVKGDKTNVNVNVPLALIRATSKFMTFGMSFVPESAREEMAKRGVDLSQIDLTELVDLIDQGLVEEKLVEVDVEDEKEGRMKVDIYVD
ncbi:MAG: SHOCT-like domain-containing protein [Bacillota bacterium]